MFQGIPSMMVAGAGTGSGGGGGSNVSVTATGSNSGESAGSPLTFTSIVNLPDTTGITLVGITYGNRDNTPQGISGVTLGGTSLTLVIKKDGVADGDNFGGVWIGKVLNSAIGSTGNKDLIVSYTGTTSNGTDTIAGVVCFNGQNASTPLGTPVSANGGSGVPTINVTDSATGGFVFDTVGNGSAITSSNQTQRWKININNISIGNGAGSTAPGASGTVTMSYVATDDGWAIAAVSVL